MLAEVDLEDQSLKLKEEIASTTGQPQPGH